MSGQRLLQYLALLEQVCRNKDILELSQDSPEWTNVLNDCIILAKRVARRVETPRFLAEDDWRRFMDIICSESKAPEMLPETAYILNVSLRIENVMSSVSSSPEFDDCLEALAQLAEMIEDDHRSGIYLGVKLWKELRQIVKENDLTVLQVPNSIPQPERNPGIQTYKERLLNMPLEDKRKLYECKSHFLTVSDIPSWQDSAPRNVLATEGEPLYPVHGVINEKISLFQGDITRLEIDAIVNSTNTHLLLGGGVDGAIHRASGPALTSECRLLKNVETGEAKITGGYLLPAKYVIQTVGPVGRHAERLRSCYKNCLKILLENNLRSIAFPCISTGIYDYPNEPAAMVALKTVRKFLQTEGNLQRIDRIIFCVYLPVDASIYKRLLPVYFPV